MTDGRDGVDPPTALSAWAAAALERASGAVLLIGPRAALLAGALGDRATVVVRGTVDARRLVSQGVHVRCGGLDRLASDTYETVVMLDPPERVLTPDSPGLGHWELLDLASTHAADRLIAFVPNALAMQRMSRQTGSGDEAWWVGTPGYDARPPVHTDLPEAPSWLVLGDMAVVQVDRLADPLVATTLRAVFPTHEGWLDAIRAEALPQLATGWIMVRGNDLPDPCAVFAPSLQQPVEGSDDEVPNGTAGRPGSSAEGNPLEVLLASALRRGDRGQLETLVTSYAAYLQSPSRNPTVSTVPRNLVVTTDGSLAARVAPDIGEPLAPTVCLALGLLDVADLVAGTNKHPFAPEADAGALARELAAFSDQNAPDMPDWAQAEALRTSDVLPVRHYRVVAQDDLSKTEERVLALEGELRERQGKIAYLQTLAARQERRIRALEHAIATEHGPRARQALFVMTAPTSRLVEAARGRLRRGTSKG